jgi:hypothetical protein
VRSITSAGRLGRRRLVSHPLASSQSRTNCLSNDGCTRPGLVSVGRPEPGRVRGQHLVDQDQLAVREPELELRVGEQDPAFGGDARPPLVQRDRDLAQALGEPAPDQITVSSNVSGRS